MSHAAAVRDDFGAGAFPHLLQQLHLSSTEQSRYDANMTVREKCDYLAIVIAKRRLPQQEAQEMLQSIGHTPASAADLVKQTKRIS